MHVTVSANVSKTVSANQDTKAAEVEIQPADVVDSAEKWISIPLTENRKARSYGFSAIPVTFALQ